MTIADEMLKPLNMRHVLPAGREDAFEPLLDSTGAAALLKIHPKTLQKLARNGEIAAIHIGKLWRFRASVLNEWLEKIAELNFVYGMRKNSEQRRKLRFDVSRRSVPFRQGGIV